VPDGKGEAEGFDAVRAGLADAVLTLVAVGDAGPQATVARTAAAKTGRRARAKAAISKVVLCNVI